MQGIADLKNYLTFAHVIETTTIRKRFRSSTE